MWIRIQTGEYINLDKYYGIGIIKDDRAGRERSDWIVVAFLEPQDTQDRRRTIITEGTLSDCKRVFDHLCFRLNAVDVDA